MINNMVANGNENKKVSPHITTTIAVTATATAAINFLLDINFSQVEIQ